jgi:hypothetical protein
LTAFLSPNETTSEVIKKRWPARAIPQVRANQPGQRVYFIFGGFPELWRNVLGAFTVDDLPNAGPSEPTIRHDPRLHSCLSLFFDHR